MENVTAYAVEKAKHFSMKAKHNKIESLFCFIMIISCSLTAPLFISLTEGKVLSKVIPSILSCISAGLTSWIQLRKPQKLWSMYRNSQRQIENEIIHFEFSIGDYHTAQNATSLFIDRVTTIAMNTHKDWITFIPSTDSISNNPK